MTLAGLGASLLALAGCGGGSAPATFDLSAPVDGVSAGRSRSILVVAEPTALQAIDSQRVVIITRAGGIAYLPDVQWSDRLPKLLQAKLIQTFENGRRVAAVGRPGDRLVPSAQLNGDIRVFGIDERSGEAVAEVSVRLVNDRSGRILAGEIFTARVPTGGASEGPAAMAALDLATQALLRDIVRWASRRV